MDGTTVRQTIVTHREEAERAIRGILMAYNRADTPDSPLATFAREALGTIERLAQSTSRDLPSPPPARR